ncbi:MAG: porin [Chitinophagaceae bacterium]|nr:porin [Oligoflexus sp.]
MQKKIVSLGALALASLFAQMAQAASEESITGYLDTYYEYNFNHPLPRHASVPVTTDPNSATYKGFTQGGTQLRNFDVQDNQFTLASAEITYKRTIENLSLKVDLDTGDNTDMMHSSSSGVDETSKHIGQAIVSYTPSSLKSLTFNFGKMLSHIGWEGAKAKDNWNYSRSLLYAFAGPYWHNGLNLSWTAVQDVFVANFYIYNGWNNRNDTNRGKTLGVQLAYAPGSGLAFVYNGIGGPEQDGNEKNKKIVHDFIATWIANEQLAFSADAIIGSEDKAIVDLANMDKSKAHWSALQMGLKYNLSPAFYLSPRIEAFWDREGYTTGASQSIREATLTTSWKVVPQFEIRMEARQDMSTHKAFIKDGALRDEQATLSLSTLVTL